jgi:hypothetical protein
VYAHIHIHIYRVEVVGAHALLVDELNEGCKVLLHREHLVIARLRDTEQERSREREREREGEGGRDRERGEGRREGKKVRRSLEGEAESGRGTEWERGREG